MGQHLTTITSTPPASRRRPRARSIRLAVVGALAVAVAAAAGVGVARLVGDWTTSGSSTERTVVVPRRAVVSPPCDGDVPALMATLAAMPTEVSSGIVQQLSPELATGIGNLAMMANPAALPPLPDARTLGILLSRMGERDRNLVLSGLSSADQLATLATVQQVFAVSAGPPACI